MPEGAVQVEELVLAGHRGALALESNCGFSSSVENDFPAETNGMK